MKIKVGDVVNLKDTSYALYVGSDGKTIFMLNTISNRKARYVVVATGLKNLPSAMGTGNNDGSINDSIIQNIETKIVIFVKEEYLILSDICSCCGQQLKENTNRKIDIKMIF